MQTIAEAEGARGARAFRGILGLALTLILTGLLAACGEQGTGAAQQQAAPPPNLAITHECCQESESCS